MKHVQLPVNLTAAERTAANTGSDRQATQYYDAARTTWQALLDKAQQEKIDNEWVNRTRDALARQRACNTTEPRREAER